MLVGCRLDLGQIIDYKLGVISQERLKISLEVNLGANIGSHISRVDWHNNG